MFNMHIRRNRYGEISVVATTSSTKDRISDEKYKRTGAPMEVIFVPDTPYLDFVRPDCSACGTATLLVGIESERRGCVLHTFQCPNCANFEAALQENVVRQ